MGMPYHTQETWEAIKTAYLTGNYTLRQLSATHGVDKSAICRKAKKENWDAIRDKLEREAQERIENAIVDTKVSNNERVARMTSTLLDKLEQAINTCSRKDVSAMRGITTSLKDLQEMGVFKVTETEDADIRVDMGSVDEYSD